MFQVTFQKNLIALEDLLIGTGTVEQTRGLDIVEVTKINGANLPYDDDYSLAEKFDLLTAAIDALPIVVDGDGNLLTGLIDTSAADISATHSGRIWRKSISGTEARIYYGTQLMFKYNPAAGDLITDVTAYIAADAVVTAAFIAADAVVTAARVAADIALGASVTAAYIAADAVVAAAYVAADSVVTDAFVAADVVLAALIEHRASVTQQGNLAASANVTYTHVYTAGPWKKVTVSSNCTFAFTFPAGEVVSMILEIVNGGAFTITWPATLQTASGDVPTLTVSGKDHVTVYQDGNNNIYASVIMADVQTI